MTPSSPPWRSIECLQMYLTCKCQPWIWTSRRPFVKELTSWISISGKLKLLSPREWFQSWSGCMTLALVSSIFQWLCPEFHELPLRVAFSFSGSPQAPAAYVDSFNDSLKLLTASFNWLTHCRKDIVRNDVKDPAIFDICGWDVPVGESHIFPFDVTKKVDESKKTKKLGSSLRKRRHQQTKGYPYKARPRQQNYGKHYKQSKKGKSFLGNSQAKKKKQQ